MEKFKKLAKELSIFGIVVICAISLLIYKQINMNDYINISAAKAVEMKDADKDFILVLGTSKISSTSSSSSSSSSTQSDPGLLTKEQASFHKAYIKKHRQKIYYVDTKDMNDLASYLNTNFGTTTTIPQTIFIKDGEVVLNKSGILKYVDFSDMVKEWKNL